MSEKENKQKLKLEKIKLLSLLPKNKELQGDIYIVKLYSSDMEGINWLYSELEGYLGLIVDYEAKTKYIAIFDQTTYQKIFQYELYKGFEKFFEDLAPDFRSFEIETGFIGLKFEKEEEAINFGNLLKKINSMKNIFNKPVVKEDQKLKKTIIDNYIKILKDNFGYNDSKYDDKYAEDGTEIFNHKNFSILNNISYDNEKKKFKFGKISEDLKKMFLSYGIKRKDLEKDLDFAFTLFKQVILGLESKKRLDSLLDKIEHSFLPPSEREKIRRQEEKAELKLYNNCNKANKKSKKNIQEKKSNIEIKGKGKRVSVPTPPPAPSAPPNFPTAVPIIKTIEAKKHLSKPEISPYDEIQKIQKSLVKVNDIKIQPKEPKEEKEEKEIDGIIKSNQKSVLEEILHAAIIKRHEALNEFTDNNDDDDDDW